MVLELEQESELPGGLLKPQWLPSPPLEVPFLKVWMEPENLHSNKNALLLLTQRPHSADHGIVCDASESNKNPTSASA